MSFIFFGNIPMALTNSFLFIIYLFIYLFIYLWGNSIYGNNAAILISIFPYLLLLL